MTLSAVLDIAVETSVAPLVIAALMDAVTCVVLLAVLAEKVRCDDGVEFCL